MSSKGARYLREWKEKKPQKYEAYLERQRLAAQIRRDKKKEKFANEVLTIDLMEDREREKALKRERNRRYREKKAAEAGRPIRPRRGRRSKTLQANGQCDIDPFDGTETYYAQERTEYNAQLPLEEAEISEGALNLVKKDPSPKMASETENIEFNGVCSPSGILQCYPFRVCPGQELKSTLAQFVRIRGLDAAFILTCVGSVTRAYLRMANSVDTKLYDKGPYEIVSLVGTLSGGSSGHLHASLSDAHGTVIGGHVLGQMIVHTTAEVVVGNVAGVAFTREPDSSTGYDELRVTKQEQQQ